MSEAPHPSWLAALAGAVGGGLAALSAGLAFLRAGPPLTRRATARAALEGAASVFGGAAAALWLAPPLAAWFGFTHADQIAAAGFVVGATFWRLLPPVLAALESAIRRRGDGGKP